MRLRSYTLHLAPEKARSRQRLVLLDDSFSWTAFLLPLPWLLAQRLFALAALYSAIAIGLGALLPPAFAGLLLIGLQLWLGFEARAIKGAWLALRGWQFIGVVMGRDRDAALLALASARPDLVRLVA